MVPGDFLRNFPHELANIWMPVFMKAAMRLEEPLQWRGGFCAHFPKPGSRGFECASNRSVVLEDTVGKIYHRTPRNLVTPAINNNIRDTQVGGFKSRATDFGTQLIRFQAEYVASEKLTSAFLPVDVTSAFYAVV